MQGILRVREEASCRRLVRWERDGEPGEAATCVAHANVFGGAGDGVAGAWSGRVMDGEEDVGTAAVMSGYE